MEHLIILHLLLLHELVVLELILLLHRHLLLLLASELIVLVAHPLLLLRITSLASAHHHVWLLVASAHAVAPAVVRLVVLVHHIRHLLVEVSQKWLTHVIAIQSTGPGLHK